MTYIPTIAPTKRADSQLQRVQVSTDTPERYRGLEIVENGPDLRELRYCENITMIIIITIVHPAKRNTQDQRKYTNSAN